MFCKPCFGGPSYVSPAATGPVTTTPPVVHPTKYCETHTCSTTIVPHIHPTHTKFVNHQMIQNQHFFPQTQSFGQTVQQTNVLGQGPGPQVAGAYAPGYPGGYPGGMPGGYPGQVAGAMTGMPGAANMGPQVAGTMKRPFGR